VYVPACVAFTDLGEAGDIVSVHPARVTELPFSEALPVQAVAPVTDQLTGNSVLMLALDGTVKAKLDGCGPTGTVAALPEPCAKPLAFVQVTLSVKAPGLDAVTLAVCEPLQAVPWQALLPTGQPVRPGVPPYVHCVAAEPADHCTLKGVPTVGADGTWMAAWNSDEAPLLPHPVPLNVTPVAARSVPPGTNRSPCASVVATQFFCSVVVRLSVTWASAERIDASINALATRETVRTENGCMGEFRLPAGDTAAHSKRNGARPPGEPLEFRTGLQKKGEPCGSPSIGLRNNRPNYEQAAPLIVQERLAR
jgi:hypothetical protein